MIEKIYQFRDCGNSYSLTFLTVYKDGSATEYFSETRGVESKECIDEYQLDGYTKVYDDED